MATHEGCLCSLCVLPFVLCDGISLCVWRQVLHHSVSGAPTDRARVTFTNIRAADRAVLASAGNAALAATEAKAAAAAAAAASAEDKAPPAAASAVPPAEASDKLEGQAAVPSPAPAADAAAGDSAAPKAAATESAAADPAAASTAAAAALPGLRVMGALVTVVFASEGAAPATAGRALRWIPARLCEALYGVGYRILTRRSPAYKHAPPPAGDGGSGAGSERGLPLCFAGQPPLKGLVARGERVRLGPGEVAEAGDPGGARGPTARMQEAPRTTAAEVRAARWAARVSRGGVADGLTVTGRLLVPVHRSKTCIGARHVSEQDIYRSKTYFGARVLLMSVYLSLSGRHVGGDASSSVSAG